MRGGNYGRSIMEGLECYEGASCDVNGLQLPRAVYGHNEGCAIIGGYVYRGASMPELNGWYVYADYCSGRIWAVDAANNSLPVLLGEAALPIVSLGELPDGELVFLTFANAVYQLQRSA